MKIATILGTRPEIVRLSCTIPALDKSFEHVLIHTGQSYDYELSDIFFKELQIRKPDYYLDTTGSTAAASIGQIIIQSDLLLRKVKPDAILILGDTNSALAAYAAKRLKIPIFHWEAGNRCYDERTPEEVNRKIVDHISDINLPYSHIARENLLREGLPPDRIIVTGSPMQEVLRTYTPKIKKSVIREQLGLVETYSILESVAVVTRPSYFVVSAHREENVSDPDQFHKLLYVLNRLAETYKLPVIVSTHPRTRKVMDHKFPADSCDKISMLVCVGRSQQIPTHKSCVAFLPRTSGRGKSPHRPNPYHRYHPYQSSHGNSSQRRPTYRNRNTG